ncbi:MAG TPA: CARDB domain-containing protein [Polyangiaceae bacterium]|nr:CARDB domain-containing protein [Polyangiaceae bacterium]
MQWGRRRQDRLKHWRGANAAGQGGGSGDASINLDGSGAADGSATCPGGCPEGQVCINGFCVTQTSCSDDEDCQNDTYCEPNVGCVPWGQPPTKTFDPTCQVGLPPGNFAPTVKCEFNTPPTGDPFPNHRDVQATPMVVNFNVGASGVPSIVVPFTATVVSNYTEDLGVVRVLRGDDCSLEANLGGGQSGHPGFVVSSSPVAVADLDGDGSSEVVARAAEGNLVAFTKKSGTWSRLWLSPTPVIAACNASNHRCSLGWAGPSIHDLNDDGIPEIVIEGSVVDGATGALLSGNPAGYASYSQGLNPVLANLDQDPAIELTNGAAIWEWAGGAWTAESYYTAPSPGFVAVADFGAYGAGLPADNPELAIVAGGALTIRAADATVILGAIAVPGGGGGAPTIADYDGDGLPEVGVAGQAFLTVYDIDCGATPRPTGTCNNTNTCDDTTGTPGACPSGILWSRRTQDISSNITGSSVFDFEDDGKAEVVYGDECFVRVYDGTDGNVLFSQARSSCTWYENPIVADTDGNFRADLVSPSNLACSDGVNGIACTMLNADGVDQQFPGVRCKENKDCVASVCDSGFCRCTATSECCSAGTDAACLDAGFKCAAPPAGTPGTGNTCRAGHPKGVQGIRVYNDSNDRWVRSRTIWNQHAYHVTHVNENGTVPKTSAWQKNWKDPDLNNFRQNVPGDASGKDSADVTAGIAGFTCGAGGALLKAPVCNRGTAPLGANVPVGFYDGATQVCSAKTTKALNPGECETVSCTWTNPPTSAKTDIQVVADDGGANTECKEGNNLGTVLGVVCQPPA